MNKTFAKVYQDDGMWKGWSTSKSKNRYYFDDIGFNTDQRAMMDMLMRAYSMYYSDAIVSIPSTTGSES